MRICFNPSASTQWDAKDYLPCPLRPLLGGYTQHKPFWHSSVCAELVTPRGVMRVEPNDWLVLTAQGWWVLPPSFLEEV